jgi:hypothetical protein
LELKQLVSVQLAMLVQPAKERFLVVQQSKDPLAIPVSTGYWES